MPPSCCIFDLDGTLVDSRRDLRNAVNRMRDHFGLDPLSLDSVTRAIGDGVRKLVERTMGPEAPDISKAIKKFRVAYEKNLYDETVLYPGVEEGLAQMRGAGILLAICSNKPEALCARILNHFGIDSLFFAVSGGDTCEEKKPSPEPIESLLQAAHCDPNSAWVIGDHVTDLKAARLAGARSIFVTYGFGRRNGEEPTHIASDFAGAADIVLFGSPP